MPSSITVVPATLTPQQLRYRKRKLAGQCCSGTCSEKTTDGHSHCHRHRKSMSRQISGIYQRRKHERLCRDCGKRPQFWGVRCVVCRQTTARDPLPRGARMALRKHREREAQSLIENRRESLRSAARRLVASEKLTVREAEALRLYLGLEDNGWRTHLQVAKLMKISGERVRQLLVPSKAALGLTLTGNVPWRRRNQNAVDIQTNHSRPGFSPNSKTPKKCSIRNTNVTRWKLEILA